MTAIPPLAREAIEHARRRDFAQALVLAHKALDQHKKDFGLRLFVGLLHAQRMELEDAATHFRAALELAPSDATARLELARTLIALEKLDEAAELLEGFSAGEARKLNAVLSFRRGRFDEGVRQFEEIVQADPRDFESWAQLGTGLLMLGDPYGAVAALERSLQMRADQPNVWEKWADAHVAAGTGEQALQRLPAAGRNESADVQLAVAAARLEDLLGRPESAVARLEAALGRNPTDAPALTALAELRERQNRIDECAEIIGRMARLAPSPEKLPLLQARLAYRRNDFDEALRCVEGASPAVDPAGRAQLIGQLRDREGDSEAAWVQFGIMNREDARGTADCDREARDYRETLERQIASLNEAWARNWTPAPAAERTPAFLVGFPRSGTTLLDTFLMRHAGVCVSEENPMLTAVSDMAGPIARLPSMNADEVGALRNVYWREAGRYVPECGERLLLDKFPFGLAAAPYIYRLFPEAPVLLVERHPCDVVLSCYFTRFQPRGAAASFVDLAGTARLYDGMMKLWSRTTELLPLRTQTVRYERLVADPAEELGAAAAFLGLDSAGELLDNSDTARERGFIKTPSYAQVAEPVYARSVGRWLRYREQLAPVLPILAPWIERLGYES